jgi:trehalose 6-phosphate phosphatase
MNPATATLPFPPANLLTGATLFLDFDGTLVDFAPSPDAVVVDARLGGLMQRLAERLQGRLAIISGRSVQQVHDLFGDVSFAVAGSHGLEMRWPDGRVLAVPRPDHLTTVEAEMDRFAFENPGVLVERKPFGAALHYRMAPQTAEACRTLACELERRTGLQLQAGNMVFELKAPWADKGSALRMFMADPEMEGTRPVFAGDDLTDEAGFAAASALGGAGILVGQPRSTAASYRLENVAETLTWLETASETLR